MLLDLGKVKVPVSNKAFILMLWLACCHIVEREKIRGHNAPKYSLQNNCEQNGI